MTPAPVFPQGFFICFDGIDGSGKTTQLVRLASRLAALGLDVVRSKEPTDGPLGRRIRESARLGRLEPREELDVLLADRREHVETLIRPSLRAGKIVLLDRYFWSTMAYQGSTLGDPAAILARNRAFAPDPDLTLLMDLPIAASQGRIVSRDGAVNNFEKAEFLSRCRDIFLSIREPNVRVVNGDGSVEAVETRVLAAVSDRMRQNLACSPSGAEAVEAFLLRLIS